MFPSSYPSGLASRVFNAHKNNTVDRQIGDRLWFNSAECHPWGPSAFLPSGYLATSLHCPLGFKLVECAVDRDDLYHQATVSRERAFTNTLPFEFDVEQGKSLRAWSEILEAEGGCFPRETHGDRLLMAPARPLREKNVQGALFGFKSFCQGVHLGVKFALESHTDLLQRGGLLPASETILGHHPFPRGPIWQGIVIDDFFTISCDQASTPNLEAVSAKILERAEEIYSNEGVFGSDDKTVKGATATSFKIIGAEVLADDRIRSTGSVFVAASLSKRLPLVILILRAACLPVITKTLAPLLAANWISVCMFRRCLCCLLSKIFTLGSHNVNDSEDVVSLTRAAAEELGLASIVGLIVSTDNSVPYDHRIYATDASIEKRAVEKKQVPGDVAERLWLGGDKRGAYTMLDALGEDCDDHHDPAELLANPSKAIPFVFNLVETFGGSGVLSKAAAELGLIKCAPIDLLRSPRHEVYHPGVAERIAAVFAKALARIEADEDAPEGPRLEGLVINDILLQDGWSILAHWHWRKPGHINILESRAFVALERRLLDEGGDCRFVVLLDSRVAKGLTPKRSSSVALRPSLLRAPVPTKLLATCIQPLALLRLA